MSRNLLTAEQVATRLGVKLPTVYAYVSRGVLGRTLAEDGRTSRFDATEVEELARRGRPRRQAAQAGVADVVLATSLTSIDGDRLTFRGHDATELARNATFECVAELLWTGTLPATVSWSPRPDALRIAHAVTAPLPDNGPVAERLALVTAALACTEPLRVDLQPPGVAAHGRSLLTVLPQALPRRGRDPADHASRRRRLATALWPRISALPATRARVRVLDAALVLLADHELATSTLAARIAASTRADPYAVVLAGLGAASGPLHGKAGIMVHQLLNDADHAESPDHAVARALSAYGSVPGFGHPVYRTTDPRAACLLELLAPLLNKRSAAVVGGVRAATASITSVAPNVDFALGALAYAAGSPVGSTEAMFVIARTAGWIAHAMEEYSEAPLRFRARAIYTGPPPRG